MTSNSEHDKHKAGKSVSKLIQTSLLNMMFYPLMVLWITVGILVFPFCVIIWSIATSWDMGRIVRHLINIHGYGLVVMVSPFVHFQKEHFDRIERPCVLVVNHLSFFDSYFISTLPFHDIVFAVGAWPFKMYWYTMFMRLARYLDVENSEWGDVMNTCTETFANKGMVLFFPEGHRSRTGKLQPFYSGAFRLAQETGVPIIPLCITGTDTMLPPGRFLLQPARVRLLALEPISPSDFPGKGGSALRDETRSRMEKALLKMREMP